MGKRGEGELWYNGEMGKRGAGEHVSPGRSNNAAVVVVVINSNNNAKNNYSILCNCGGQGSFHELSHHSSCHPVLLAPFQSPGNWNAYRLCFLLELPQLASGEIVFKLGSLIPGAVCALFTELSCLCRWEVDVEKRSQALQGFGRGEWWCRDEKGGFRLQVVQGDGEVQRAGVAWLV